MAEEVILRTAGQLATYYKEVEIAFKQIRRLIKGFVDVWAFTDVNFCPVLGPFLGFIGREVVDDGITDQEETELIRKATF